MPQPPAVQAIADPLIESYRAGWERILSEEERITSDPKQWRRVRKLREMSQTIGSILDGLDSETADWVASQYPKIYGAGLVDGAAAAGESAVWSMIHQEAVEQLAYGVYNDLLSATTHVRDTTKDLIRTLARQEGTAALITGETAQAAGRKLAKELATNGISAVTYKNGARVGLEQYAEMNLRTTTALGYNNGTLNASPTTVFWECFDGPGCGWSFHEDTEQALGKIVTRDEALGYPISHPNCRRAFGPRPDLNKTASAKEKLGSVKPTQVEAQRAQDAERLVKQGRSPRTPREPRKSPVPPPPVMAERYTGLVQDQIAAMTADHAGSLDEALRLRPGDMNEDAAIRAWLKDTNPNPLGTDIGERVLYDLPEVAGKSVDEAMEFYQGAMTKEAMSIYSGNRASVVKTTEAREFYDHYYRQVSLRARTNPRVAVHEFGHHFENELKGVQLRARAFLKHRRGDEKLSEIYRGSGEMGWRDKFIDHYMGKSYPKDTEILAMGFEQLYATPAKLLKKDPEYFWFMVGILRGRIY